MKLGDVPTQNIHALTAVILAAVFVLVTLAMQARGLEINEEVTEALAMFCLLYAGVEGARFFGKRRTDFRQNGGSAGEAE